MERMVAEVMLFPLKEGGGCLHPWHAVVDDSAIVDVICKLDDLNDI